jgi:hypothetical protein
MTPIDPIPDGLTFAILLTAAGTGVAAALITGLVSLVKSVFPALDARLSGAALAFIGSLILYVLAGIAVGVDSLDEGLVVFVSWLTCATAAVGVHQVVAKRGLTN